MAPSHSIYGSFVASHTASAGMLSIIRLLFLVCYQLILTESNAIAQEHLPLQQAINIALKNNLELELARNYEQATEINDHYGVAGGLPTVIASINDNEQITNINQKLNNGTVIKRIGAEGNQFSAGISTSILLYNGMRVVTTKQRLAELKNQSAYFTNAQIQDVIAAVMTTYYDIVRQQSYLKTLDQSIEVSRQRLNIIEVRQSVGLANNADLFQTQLDLNALLQTRESQILIISQAKTNMLTLMHAKPDSAISIIDTILVDANLKLEHVLENLHQNAQVQAADNQVRINELIEKETLAQRYPSLRLNSGYNFNLSRSAGGFNLYNQTIGPFIGLNLTIPIYNGSVFKRQQQVAELNTDNASIQKEILIRDSKASAVRSFLAYQNSLEQLKTEKENYQLARQLLDLVLQRYEFRVATIIDLEVAQQTFEDAGFRLINLSYAAKAAEIELKRLVNELAF